jgi:flagellar secretion chaperone FliS
VKLQQHYRSDSVATASPAQLVTMLYDRALQGIHAARLHLTPEATAPNRLELANKELVHVQRIVTELQVTLDFERGGDVARSLDDLYTWCLSQLVEANLTKNPVPLDSVEKTISGIRDAWVTASAEASQPVRS